MNNKEIAEKLTEKFIKEMESGIIPWKRPWFGSDGYISHSSGKPYSFFNSALLAMDKKPEGEYLTFKQCQQEGGKVRKGEKSTLICFWKMQIKEALNPDTQETEKHMFPILKTYNVFHISQCEGIEPKYNNKPLKLADPVKAAEQIITGYQAREKISIIRNISGNRAFYSPSLDYIQVPMMTQFSDSSEYYSTLFHEMTHSTGHFTRLGRFKENDSCAAFGSEDYSKEELIAEIGAATLINKIHLETAASFRNSAAYLQSWLTALKNDPMMLISACGKSEKAVNYILNIKEGDPDE